MMSRMRRRNAAWLTTDAAIEPPIRFCCCSKWKWTSGGPPTARTYRCPCAGARVSGVLCGAGGMTAASDWLILTEPVETPQLQNRYLNSVLIAQ
jgi:hypothetical protein